MTRGPIVPSMIGRSNDLPLGLSVTVPVLFCAGLMVLAVVVAMLRSSRFWFKPGQECGQRYPEDRDSRARVQSNQGTGSPRVNQSQCRAIGRAFRRGREPP